MVIGGVGVGGGGDMVLRGFEFLGLARKASSS